MVDRADDKELLEALFETLAKGLLPHDWMLVSGYSGDPRDLHVKGGPLGFFSRVLRNHFVATAMFGWEHGRELHEFVVTGWVGVEYELARGLLRNFTGSAVSGVAVNERTVSVLLSGRHDLLKSDELVQFVLDQRLLYDQLADVDAVVDSLRLRRATPFAGEVADIDDVDEAHAAHMEGQLLPAVFAAAGRYSEARAALAEYRESGSEHGWAPREFRRFVRQLTRVIDAQGVLPLPRTPPQWPPPPTWRECSCDMRDVVDDRGSAAGYHALDLKVEAGQEYGGLELPDHATYPIVNCGYRDPMVDVALEPTASDLLDRLARELPRGSGNLPHVVDVWLAWDADAPASELNLTVHIGAVIVGRLGPDGASRLRGAMEAAAEREESPWMHAFLTAGSGDTPNTLEIALPKL